MKKILFLFFVFPMAINAANLSDNIDLAKKCHQIALYLDKIFIVEEVSFCKQRLNSASMYTEEAANDLASEDVYIAKLGLKLAIGELVYSVVEDCVKANEILLTKNELQRIYNII